MLIAPLPTCGGVSFAVPTDAGLSGTAAGPGVGAGVAPPAAGGPVATTPARRPTVNGGFELPTVNQMLPALSAPIPSGGPLLGRWKTSAVGVADGMILTIAFPGVPFKELS